METACLRIKFTPFLQRPQNQHSKCCLEIVPQVSCIHNFDKIQWREENNLIEYVIPMRYKIIVKKQEKNDETVKTYHSCIDLPLPSSIENLSFASGDVAKITSDTLILNKFTSNTPSFSNDNVIIKTEEFSNSISNTILSPIKVNSSPVSINTKHIPLNKTTSTALIVTDEVSQLSEDNVIETKFVTKVEPTRRVSDKTLLDKGTDTNNIFPFGNVTGQNIKEIHYTSIKKLSKPDFKRRLSLTPICSISTQESKCETKMVTSKAVVCNLPDFDTDMIQFKSVGSPSDISYDIQTSNHLSEPANELTSLFNSCTYESNFRILPEIRIAQYVRLMENEMMPLKVTLNKIIHTCSVLGVIEVKKAPGNALMYKPISNQEAIGMEHMQQPTPNRVVYSVIFDD